MAEGKAKRFRRPPIDQRAQLEHRSVLSVRGQN
jgi:hypothetical protein